MMTNKFLLAIAFVSLTACGHNLRFAANHFAVPVTAESQWGGHVAVGATGVTNITVIQDITTNPPNRDKVLINESWDTGTIYSHKIDVNASLSIYDALEVYSDSNVYGLRWQFLNHNQTPEQWVAAVQAGYGQRSQGTDISSSNGDYSNAESKIKSTQVGLSVGYKLPVGSVAYGSYVYENHEAETKVDSNDGNFGPYNDRGVHQSLGFGLASYHRGLNFAVEYSFNNIAWDRAASTGQNSLGGNIGYAW